MSSIYDGQYIAFTTKHHKEDVVLPNFRKYLGATLIVPWIDTDKLGTFSGEMERPGNALEVADKKAKLGMEATGLPFGLASEGSFRPHPYIPFLPSDQEIMLFIDNERGFKLHEVIVSEKTNFAQLAVSNLDEADQFLHSAHFPTHGIIVRPNIWEDKSVIFKGIRNMGELEAAFNKCLHVSADSKVWLETDMRANVNPSRMGVIGELAERLAKRLSSECPRCSAPGWGCVKVERGLPCEYCGQPTEMVASQVFGCVLCDHLLTLPGADGITKAEQVYCGWCNP